VVERPRALVEVERFESERPREPVPALARIGALRRDRRVRAVELLGPAADGERLQGMDGESPAVRLECRERRRTADVRDEGARLHAARDIRDRRVRNAEEDERGALFAHLDPALAEAGEDGRADPAAADDVNAVGHLFRTPVPRGYRASESLSGEARRARKLE